MNKFLKQSIMFLVMVMMSQSAFSEQCWQFGDCKGLVGYMRIDRNDYTFKAILNFFGQENLPDVNSIVEIKRSGYLRNGFIAERDDQPINTKSSSGWGKWGIPGDYMAAGTKVKILGYRMETYLFALVQIVEYSKDPYKDQFKFKFELEDVL